jgi:hypothetical protein
MDVVLPSSTASKPVNECLEGRKGGCDHIGHLVLETLQACCALVFAGVCVQGRYECVR